MAAPLNAGKLDKKIWFPTLTVIVFLLGAFSTPYIIADKFFPVPNIRQPMIIGALASYHIVVLMLCLLFVSFLPNIRAVRFLACVCCFMWTLISFLLVFINRIFGLGSAGFFSFLRVDFKTLGKMLHQTMIQPAQLGVFVAVGIAVLLFLLAVWRWDCSPGSRTVRLRKMAVGFYLSVIVMAYCSVRLIVYKVDPFYQSIELTMVPFKQSIIPSEHLAEIPVSFERNAAEYIPQTCEPCVAADADGTPDNIVIYVIESIPASFINQEDTPDIYQLKTEARNFTNAYSPSNSTHNAVFSIFSGVTPFRFVQVTKNLPWKASPPIQALKDLGYRIRLFNTDPYYEYLNVLNSAFGPEYDSVDEKFTAKDFNGAPDRDQKLLKGMHQSIAKHSGNGKNVFIVFLDSTHHNYFFPETFARKKTPLIEQFNYLKWDYSAEDVMLIRNRYITSLRFMDSIVGESIRFLRETGLYEKTTVALLADHGEEFMEFGSLIHGSNLRDPQMKVPMIVKHADKTENFADDTPVSTIDLVPNLFPKLAGVHEWLERNSNATSLATRKARGVVVTANSRSALVPSIFAVNAKDQTLEFELDEHSPIDTITAKLRKVWVDGNSRSLAVNESYLKERVFPLLCGELFDDVFFRCRK